jgi:hypothetical protein
MDAFEKHFDQCPHCYLKRGYDLEMNARIERAYTANNAAVAQHLQSAEPLPTRKREVVAGAVNADDAQAAGVKKARK